jgi:hypothetical protein
MTIACYRQHRCLTLQKAQEPVLSGVEGTGHQQFQNGKEKTKAESLGPPAWKFNIQIYTLSQPRNPLAA